MCIKDIPENVSTNESIKKQEQFSITLMRDHQQPTWATDNFVFLTPSTSMNCKRRNTHTSIMRKKSGLSVLPTIQESYMACRKSCFSTPSAKPIIPRPKHGTTSTPSPLPEPHFTNHESLPSSVYAFSNFIARNPRYTSTELADHIRDRDYCHLADHVCFDYTGVGLLSHSQLSSIAQICHLQPNFFKIACKSVSLKSQLSYGSHETALEAAIRRRIMDFLKISDEQYTMVCTANKTSAFKILAESYPFHSNKKLLTVYDHESEAVRSMVDSAKKRGAKVMSAEFCWPSMKIHSEKLKKMVIKRNQKRGLFVFPPESQMTGSRYPYKWMSLAQKNGWHVVLDACSLGPKDMNTLGLSLIEPDFIICSFFKIFGEDPSGFACLFVKRSSKTVLEMSSAEMSTGIISIIPTRRPSNLPEPGDGLATGLEIQPSNIEVIRPSSDLRLGPSPPTSKLKQGKIKSLQDLMNNEKEATGEPSSRITKLQKSENNVEIECRCLDHADSMGLLQISKRLSCLTDWLVNALLKLKHHQIENGRPLVRIYGPQIKLNRGSALAINLFDWKGEKIEPALVQKLADRSNISISRGYLQNIWFAVKYEGDKSKILGKILLEATTDARKEEKIDLGVAVVNVSLNFLNNFEDAYRLWSFIAKFLDADFIDKERWRYFALNQSMVEI